MFQLIKIHKWALLFAFLVGIIVAFPQFYFPYDHADTYNGIYIATTDNEVGYLGRIQEVRDGHPLLGSINFKDGKDNPYIQSPLGEILIAYLGKIFFLDLNGTILLARFIFAFLGFLAIYGFVFLLSKEKLIAISAAAAVCLAKSLLSRGALIALLEGGAPTAYFLDNYRPVHPMVSFLFLFSFLVFFWLFFDKKQWRWGVISILILGLSFYLYPYTWSFIYAFLGILCLILLFQKKWQDIKRIILMALGGVVIAIPYLLNIYRSILHPYFNEVNVRFGLVETHQLILGFLVPSIFIVFLIFFPKNWRQRYIFSLALLIAPFIVLNQQLITGKDFHSGHYHWFFNQPLTIIFLIMIFLYQTRFWQEKLKLFKNIDISKILACLIIGASFYTGIVVQAASYKESESQILGDQRSGPVTEWLNSNAKKEEVVLADIHQSDIVSIYTSLNQFYAFSSPYYFAASNERVLNALFLFYRLDGLKGEDAQALFFQKQARYIISKTVFGVYYRDMFGSAEAIPDQVLDSFVQKYQDFLLIPLDKFLKMNDVKYVVWDIRDFPQWRLDQYDFLSEVYGKGDFKIYQIN